MHCFVKSLSIHEILLHQLIFWDKFILSLLQVLKVIPKLFQLLLIEVFELNITRGILLFDKLLQLNDALLMIIICVEVGHKFICWAVMILYFNIFHHLGELLDYLSSCLRVHTFDWAHRWNHNIVKIIFKQQLIFLNLESFVLQLWESQWLLMLVHLDNLRLDFWFLVRFIPTNDCWLQHWPLVRIHLIREGILRLKSCQRLCVGINLLHDLRLENLYWGILYHIYLDWWSCFNLWLVLSVRFSPSLFLWLSLWIFCGRFRVGSLLVNTWVFDVSLLTIRPFGDERIAQCLGVNFYELFKLTWWNAWGLGVLLTLFALVLAGAKCDLAHVGAVLRVCVIV